MSQTVLERMTSRYAINDFGDLGVRASDAKKESSTDSDLRGCGVRGEIRPEGGKTYPIKTPKWDECKPSIPQY